MSDLLVVGVWNEKNIQKTSKIVCKIETLT